jgi:hypothetical protein
VHSTRPTWRSRRLDSRAFDLSGRITIVPKPCSRPWPSRLTAMNGRSRGTRAGCWRRTKVAHNTLISGVRNGRGLAGLFGPGSRR